MSVNFNATYPWNAIESVTIDGEAMVKIPKFYVKHHIPSTGDYAGKKCWEISQEKVDDTWHCHPAFMLNGQEIDCFYIGAYEGYNKGSNICGSAAGKTPWVSLGGFENAKTYCSNRGAAAGWHLQTIYERHAISLLFLLEYGHPNAQTAIGAGNVNSSAAVSTGSTNAVYRGMHELWGNVWEHVDGIKGDGSGNILIWDNKGNHTYKTTGKKPVGTHGQFILDTLSDKGTDFDFGDVFIPGSTAAEGSATYPDVYYGLANDFVLFVSGHWYYGTGCGLFTFNVNGGVSISNSSSGLRLAKYPS